MVCVIQACWQFASRIRMETFWSCSQTVRHIPLLCVQWKIPDDGQRNCPKHVEFYCKNKFEKLVHLVGFIIRNDFKVFNWLPGQCLKIRPVCFLPIHRPLHATPTCTITYITRRFVMRSKALCGVELHWNHKHHYRVYQSLLLRFNPP